MEERRGYIKLEFPESARTKAEMDHIIKELVAPLEHCLEIRDIRIVNQQPTQIVEEQDCDSFFEVTIEVASKKFTETLLDAMKSYLEKFLEISVMYLPIVVLNTSDFWVTPLASDVKDEPLTAIYFGNVQGGSFLSHWEVSFWQKTVKGRLNKLSVDFEFDKTDMMMVQFQCAEKVKDRTDYVSYQVTIRRDTVRRIIVNPVVSDCYGRDRTRFHFELNCPPLIRRGTVDKEKRGNLYALPFYHRRKTFKFDWDKHGFPKDDTISDSPFFTIEFHRSVTSAEIYRILCRLKARTGASIEFGFLPSVNIPVGRWSPYNRWTIISISDGRFNHRRVTDSEVPIFRDFLWKLFPQKWEIRDGKEIDVNDERKFSITYLIECLLSRGAVVKDQLLLYERHWSNFLEVIILYYQIDDKLCEAALEDLVHLIDGRKRIGSIIKCFDRVCQKRLKMKLVNGLSENEIKEGFQRVRKVVFTPTRVIYVAPETIMGNRVLRKYDPDGTKVLRVTFRDDNNQKMRSNFTEDLLEETAHKYLECGVRVANRDFGFLGCSNSQMRDNGAYFMLKYSDTQLERFFKRTPNGVKENFQPKINDVRRHLGRFQKIESIPKMMARLGQCFTQSRLTGVELIRTDYCRTFDLTGGKNKPVDGEEYTFSDGVGLMSYGFAHQVAQAMKWGKCVPSCFQIRFRGMKGVVAIDPILDDIRKWALCYGIPELDDRQSWNVKCAFRPSQIKFEAKSVAGEQLEMVKHSSPVLVALNKPFINILDQVSEMQSLECHRRVTGRIEELMDRQILSFARQMNEETYCRNKLKEFPRRIDIDYLNTMWGFTLSNEPFFRSLIKASIKFSITKQLRKEQIQIPKELGRSMLGVVDETGRLQYGQVFVQFTRNAQKKFPIRTSDMGVQGSEIVTGKVLLTKNPCIVSGDVRIFEAVDIPELRHHCDVIVFPQHGPRPHPDEMAGSDLDGDEYSVIWDRKLLLIRNESPFDFSVEKKRVWYDPAQIDALMREFYVKYLKLDSVGQISNAHLFNADQYGLNSEVCMNLAKKNCQAVDFTKSGDPPGDLIRNWTKDEETMQMIPPERPERCPDFNMANERTPMYISPRLCGKLFREFQAIDEVIKISEERDVECDVAIDESITIAGFERYLDDALENLSNYNGQLRSIMENYGIKTEGEIMSGCIVEMRNRISDKDQDDMSFYNTNQMIETRITTLVCKFRESFFTEFGGFREACTQLPNTFDPNNCLNYRCDNPTGKMMQKAVAWYRTCYEYAQATRQDRKLSFAWLVYDVIAKVKERGILDAENVKMGGSNPMYAFLEQHRAQYLSDHKEDFQSFLENTHDNDEKAWQITRMYLRKTPGLDTVLFILLEWARKSNLFELEAIKEHHFSLLLIMFATRMIASVDGNAKPYFPKIESEDSGEEEVTPLTEEMRSNLMVKFLEYVSSRKFRKLSCLSFQPIGLSSVFMRGEWKAYHVAAIKTYYNILFNLRFEELPISTDSAITVRSVFREAEPFVIELPENMDVNLVMSKMIEHSGVHEVKIRRMGAQEKKKDNDESEPCVRYIVSSAGSLESLQRLKKLVAVEIPIKSHLEGQEVSHQMAFLCYKRIIDGCI